MSFRRREFLRLLAAGGAAVVAGGPRRVLAGDVLAPGTVVEGGPPPAREASWYEKLAEGRVKCGLCPRQCEVADLERGTCGVRENRGGVYHTLNWGMACAVHADPVEKKPFFHVLPGSSALSYAAAGCNVECKFCQNWEISQFRPEQVRSWYLPPEALVELARRSGTKLTAATYSEPVVFWEYVRDAADAARAAGLKTAVVSNGFIRPTPLAEVLPRLDAVKIDLKAFTETFYREQVRGELAPVLESLQAVRAAGVWLEIVVLLVPTLNDGEAEIRAMAGWIAEHLGRDVPLHFTRFHPTYRLANLPPTPVATLERAWRVAREAGLHFVYLGNVPGHPGENTVCPGCGEELIRRMGFTVLANRLQHGACPACHAAIPGRWE